MHPVATTTAHPRAFDALVRAMASDLLDPRTVGLAEERALLEGFKASEKNLLHKIEAQVAQGTTRAAGRTADRLRRSMAGRYLALWRTKPRELSDNGRASAVERDAVRAARIAQILSLLGHVGNFKEAARATVFTKRKGDHMKAHRYVAQPMSARGNPTREARRVIFQFGWIDKARQRLLARSLEPFANYHPSQFLLRRVHGGRGRSGVCEHLRRHVPMLSAGHVFLQVDVRDFYGSISPAWIEKRFRLPLEMIRRHIHSGDMTLRVDGRARAYLSGGENDERVRRVLPQGSALSSLISEIAMAEVLGGLADHLSGALVVTYSDNLGIFVPNGEAAAIEDHLRRAFGSSGVGPFKLQTSTPVPITSEFKFLGHHWRLEGDALRTAIREHAAAGRAIFLGEQIMSAPDVFQLRKVRGRIMAQAHEWQFWPDVGRWRDDLLATAHSALEAFELDVPHTG